MMVHDPKSFWAMTTIFLRVRRRLLKKNGHLRDTWFLGPASHCPMVAASCSEAQQIVLVESVAFATVAVLVGTVATRRIRGLRMRFLFIFSRRLAVKRGALKGRITRFLFCVFVCFFRGEEGGEGGGALKNTEIRFVCFWGGLESEGWMRASCLVPSWLFLTSGSLAGRLVGRETKRKTWEPRRLGGTCWVPGRPFGDQKRSKAKSFSQMDFWPPL